MSYPICERATPVFQSEGLISDPHDVFMLTLYHSQLLLVRGYLLSFNIMCNKFEFPIGNSSRVGGGRRVVRGVNGEG